MRTNVWGTIQAGSPQGKFSAPAMELYLCSSLGSHPGGSLFWIVLGPIFKLKKRPERGRLNFTTVNRVLFYYLGSV